MKSFSRPRPALASGTAAIALTALSGAIAVALPEGRSANRLAQNDRPPGSRQSEGTTYTGTLNRLQRDFYLENGRFAIDLATLAPEFPAQTDLYRFSVMATDREAIATAEALAPDLKSFRGIVRINALGQPVALLCITANPGEPPDRATRSSSDPSQPCAFPD